MSPLCRHGDIPLSTELHRSLSSHTDRPRSGSSTQCRVSTTSRRAPGTCYPRVRSYCDWAKGVRPHTWRIAIPVPRVRWKSRQRCWYESTSTHRTWADPKFKLILTSLLYEPPSTTLSQPHIEKMHSMEKRSMLGTSPSSKAYRSLVTVLATKLS